MLNHVVNRPTLFLDLHNVTLSICKYPHIVRIPFKMHRTIPAREANYRVYFCRVIHAGRTNELQASGHVASSLATQDWSNQVFRANGLSPRKKISFRTLQFSPSNRVIALASLSIWRSCGWIVVFKHPDCPDNPIFMPCKF